MDLGISGPVKEGETKIEKRKMCRSPDALQQKCSRKHRKSRGSGTSGSSGRSSGDPSSRAV